MKSKAEQVVNDAIEKMNMEEHEALLVLQNVIKTRILALDTLDTIPAERLANKYYEQLDVIEIRLEEE